MVLLVMFSVLPVRIVKPAGRDVFQMPPPMPLAELPEMVLLVTFSMPLLPLRMPPPLVAELPEMVLLVKVTMPPLLKMPPPLAELPFSMVRPEMNTVTLVIQNTEPTAALLFPLTARMDAPGPLMVRFWLIVSPQPALPVVSVIGPVSPA